MTRKQPTFTFQRRDGTLEALDKLRAREPSPPSRGEMINLLIERAEAALTQVKQPSPEHRQQPRVSDDEKAVRPGRRGLGSALKKQVGPNSCPDCGANLNLVGARHNCTGKKK